MTSDIALVLFRRDLRLADHAALIMGSKHAAVIPVYVRELADPWAPGGASRWWLHESLASLNASLEQRGSRLILQKGHLLPTIRKLVKDSGATAVYWNRRYDPFGEETDALLKAGLRADGLTAESFNGVLMREPWDVETKTKTPYAVFTAFAKTFNAMPPPALPRPIPKTLAPPGVWPKSLRLDDLGLAPTTPPQGPWHLGMADAWIPGETAGKRSIGTFIKGAMGDYTRTHDIPGERGTSRLSPYLAFGEISPRQAWHTVQASLAGRKPHETAGAAVFLKELIWREFAYHLLHYHPTLPTTPLNKKFVQFGWEDRPDWVRAWQRGQTGYPIVDAGMRELWTTGWMHNRVRMVVASFLVKHLLTPWQVGAAWFWDTLVDADLASNSQNWQWCAGCGVDAAPYFRVFNPILQGARFDAAGIYVRKWVPEIAGLPDRYIHTPWDAPESALRAANIMMGTTYPKPIVDHGAARTAALVRYERMRRDTSTAAPKR